MLKKLSWKQKNKLLLIAGLVLLWTVYSFAISNTIEVRSQCIVLQQQIDSASGAPLRLAALQQEFQQLETITNSNDTSNTLHERLLGVVTNYCQQNNTVLRDFALDVGLDFAATFFFAFIAPLSDQVQIASYATMVALFSHAST